VGAVTAFFVPGVGPGQAETRYAEVAGAAAGSPEERFASIRWDNPFTVAHRDTRQVERFA
jgi:hypothetical protein